MILLAERCFAEQEHGVLISYFQEVGISAYVYSTSSVSQNYSAIERINR